MSAMIYYMTHGGRAMETNLILPHWERYGIPITVVSPKDSALWHPLHKNMIWGDKGPHGDAMYKRIIHILDDIVYGDATDALLVEFDCMCLLDEITFRNGLYGTPQARYYDHLIEFMAERYVTPPYMLDRGSAEEMLNVAKRYPDVREGGYADRLLAALANLAGVPVMGFPEGSWSRCDWKPEELEPGMAMSIKEAVNKGCKWFHFIKTKQQFDYVLNCAKNRS